MSLSTKQIAFIKANASLILGPSTPYGIGGFQAIRPFTEAGRFDFTRNGPGTVEKTDSLVSMPENVPRIDKDGALLFEPARTNLATYSQSFGAGTGWNKLNTTVGASTIDPFNENNATQIFETSVNDVHAVSKDTSITNGVRYTCSVYVKSIGGRDVSFSGSTGFTGGLLIVDLSDGSILQGDGKVETAPNDFYRISWDVVASDVTGTILIYSSIGTSLSNPGDVTKGIELFGYQVEAGSYATGYMPTDASTFTRPQDNNLLLLRNGIKGESESTVFICFFNYSKDAAVFSLSVGGSINNRVRIDTNSSGGIGASAVNAGLVEANFNDLTNIQNSSVKTCLSLKNNEIKLFSNGSKIGEDFSYSYLDYDQIRLNTRSNGSVPGSNGFFVFSIIPRSLSDSESESLTI